MPLAPVAPAEEVPLVVPVDPLAPVVPAAEPLAPVAPAALVVPVNVAGSVAAAPGVALALTDELPVTPVGPAGVPGKAVVVVTSSVFGTVVDPVAPVVTEPPVVPGIVTVPADAVSSVWVAGPWWSLAWCAADTDDAAIIARGSVIGAAANAAADRLPWW